MDSVVDLELLKTNEIISLYSDVMVELKKRDVIRTKNLIGDLGEYLAINHYNNTSNLPNLREAAIGTKNIDAISRDGDRYSIKSTTGRLTGVFYGLNSPDSEETDSQKFEFLIIVIFDDEFRLHKILEVSWELFLKYKRWHTTMNAWNISITKKLTSDAVCIYQR